MDKTTLHAIRALRRKKERSEQGRFVVEGDKGVAELVESSIAVERMYYVSAMEHAVPESHRHLSEQISIKDMERISQMNTAPGVLAVASIPNRLPEEVVHSVAESPMSFGLIGCRLQDPGNLGTLLRVADWFGFGGVFITEGTVDPWNAKTVQASMGSIFRVPVTEVSMEYLHTLSGHFHLEMQGTPHAEVDWKHGWIWVGSESHGFEGMNLPTDSTAVHIPRVGAAESLNAGVAAAIVCSEIARRKANW
ncbi:MAG: TrmH family RNA methyltransferase [Flavobacteriales bacterium]